MNAIESGGLKKAAASLDDLNNLIVEGKQYPYEEFEAIWRLSIRRLAVDQLGEAYVVSQIQGKFKKSDYYAFKQRGTVIELRQGKKGSSVVDVYGLNIPYNAELFARLN